MEQPEGERLLRHRRVALLEAARQEAGRLVEHLDAVAASYRRVRAMAAEDDGLRHMIAEHLGERATDFWSETLFHSEWRKLLDYTLANVQHLVEQHLRAKPPQATTGRR